MAKTIEEVARALGVSVTTVRLVTAGKGARYRISQATRQLVENYVGQHGLRINQSARSLKLQRSDAIGLVIPEINNPFFADLAAALEVRCRGEGLVLLTASTQDDPVLVARALDTLIGRGVDGLIVASSTEEDHAAVLARDIRPPLVFVDRVFPGAAPAVATDHRAASVALTGAMRRADPRPIAFLHANPELPSIAARLDGFRAASGASDLALGAGRDTVPAGRALMSQLLDITVLGTHGILCSSLLVLEGVVKELRARGLTLPEDLKLGTFDDHPMLDFLSCPVIAAAQDVGAIADALFRSIQRSSSAGDGTLLLGARLIWRPLRAGDAVGLPVPG